MAIDNKKLDLTLSLIKEDRFGYSFSGEFLTVDASLITLPLDDTHRLEIYNLVQFARQDISNLLNIIWRLEWQKQLRTDGFLDEARWTNFAALDIDLFHIEFRSFFDYVARLLALVSDHPTVKDKSFEKLKNWLSKSRDNCQRFGEDLSELVLSCTWFDDIREIRNSTVHCGGYPHIFPKTDKILFQHYGFRHNGKFSSYIRMPDNEGVADFRLYVGLYMGYLLAWLEWMSPIFIKRLKLRQIGIGSSWIHPVFGLLREWILEILACDENHEQNLGN